MKDKVTALEVGCGPRDRWIPNTDGIDLRDFGQKYIGDFLSYDFKDKKFEVIFAHHMIEHLEDITKFFDKAGEILVDGGAIDIRVPILPYDQAFVDPTHKTFIVFPDMFLYFTDKSPAGHCYSKTKYKVSYFEPGRWEWEGHIVLIKDEGN